MTSSNTAKPGFHWHTVAHHAGTGQIRRRYFDNAKDAKVWYDYLAEHTRVYEYVCLYSHGIVWTYTNPLTRRDQTKSDRG